MNSTFFIRSGVAALVATLSISTHVVAAEAVGSPAPSSVDRASVEQIIAQWPERPRLGATMMLTKYGVPQEVSPMNLVWHNQGVFKRIMVTRQEIPHDFPKPHMDFMEHTIAYRVPADKSDEIIEYDGSVTINRTAGEMSARCDLEGHNILTLNLAHDIVVGKKDAKEARKAFGEIVVEDVLGKNPDYVTGLRFKLDQNVMDADKPVIPGSPKRPGTADDAKSSKSGMGDAEVLGFLVAVNENKILAAAEAKNKKVSAPIMAYAKMLHEDHGKNLVETLKIGKKIDVVPLEAPAVDALRVKGAGELAVLLPLDGETFAAAYIAAMIKGHTEVLKLIDTKLLASTTNDELKSHVTASRAHIAHHLKAAQDIQSGMKR